MASSSAQIGPRTRKTYFLRLSSRGLSVRYTFFRHLAALNDCCWFALAALVSHLLYTSLYPAAYGFHSSQSALGLGLITGILYAVICRAEGLYLLPSLLRANGTVLPAVGYSAIALSISVAMLFMVRAGPDVSRGTFLIFVPLVGMSVLINRFVVEQLTRSLLSSRTLVGPSVISIGTRSELSHLDPTTLMSDYGLNEIGRVAIDDNSFGTEAKGVAAALALSRARGAEKFVVASNWSDIDMLAVIQVGLRNSALPALLLPDSVVRRIRADESRMRGQIPLQPIELQLAPMNAARLVSKRCLDVVLSMVALVVLSPVMVFAAIAIKVDTSGPVIFRQTRHGFDRRPFKILKFRSMRVLDDGPLVVQATKGDTRVTRVGRFLRRTSIDEIPQLFNVLVGQMSLVGPRPHALSHDDTYTDLIDRYCFRHHVKPGITGWAQVNGARGQTQIIQMMKDRVDLDLWYIAHCSLRLDLVILARTCMEVLRHEAY